MFRKTSNTADTSEYLQLPPAGDIIAWCRDNGIIPLPCRRWSKAPHGCISTNSLYGDNPPSPEDLVSKYGRRMFGSRVKDSFHIPSPERLQAIERYWEDPGVMKKRADSISISIDMNYPTEDGYTVGCIDVDSECHIDLLDCPEWPDAPVVRGKKGGKVFFKLDRKAAETPPIIQLTTEENLGRPGKEQDPPVIELFTGNKHALIYGMHPDGNTDHPIYYTFMRGFGLPVPVLLWQDILRALVAYAEKNELVFRKSPDELPEGQTRLDEVRWNGDISVEKRHNNVRMFGQLKLHFWGREKDPG